MASNQPIQLQELPNEILLQIFSCMVVAWHTRTIQLTGPLPLSLDLSDYHITNLQLVSRRLRSICLDEELWKQRCFAESSFLEGILRSRRTERQLAGATSTATEPGEGDATTNTHNADADPHSIGISRELQRRSDLANWDPVFPGERVSWYHEYIQRYGPIATSWFQQPRGRDGNAEDTVDVRGVALYAPSQSDTGLFAVSPLDDGSVCLWDVRGSRGRKGAILSRSSPGILFIDGPGGDNTRRSKKIDTGFSECVSVDSRGNRAFVAVQSRTLASAIVRI
jgi:hypothetical protein